MAASGRASRSALVVAGGFLTLLVAGCSGAPAAGGSPQPIPGPTQVVEIGYSNGVVQGGVSRTPVLLGRKVRLVVNSDVADEVHVHGYDLKAEVPAHGVGTVEFVADQSGVFEVELESRGVQLAQLEVR